VYHPQFVDHVNALDYHGLAGARKSVAVYLALFPDLRFVVDEQVSEGDRVVSRWTLTGTHRGRRVRVWRIVISRLVAELPADCEVVAYCRAPLCAYAHQAVRTLQAAGRAARRTEEGWPEWRLADIEEKAA